jgi:zinc protease
MRVLLFPDPSKPTVTVNITYLVGSRHEGYGEAGMAHLLEHLVFKGTPKHPNIPQELTERGARPNGTTWWDRTNYFETVPSTDANLEWAIDLEADRMVNSFIAKKDLESEFSVVRNEFESGENDPIGVLFERTISTAYLWHNYGKSTIGARSDIENVPIERLQAFYRKYYQPDNAILVVAGKFDEAKALSLIVQKFGVLPKPVRSIEQGNLLFATYTREPVQDGERQVTLRRVGDAPVAMAAFHTPAAAHADFAALDVLNSVLSDEPSGRLYKALVEPKIAAQVGSLLFPTREPGFVVSYTVLQKEQNLESARAALVKALDDLTAQAPTAEEVARAKTALLKEIELTLNNSERVGLDLTEWAAAGDWRMLFLHRDRIEQVTPGDVQRVAAAYFKSANRTIGLFVPTEAPIRAEIAEAPDVESLVRDYKGRAVVAAGEAFDPSPSNIDSRTTRSALANGFKVQVLPKQTRGGSVHVQLNLRYGSEGSLMGRGTAANVMAQMFDRGTKSKTRQQVKDAFDQLKSRVTVSGQTALITANVETTRPNLLPTLRLLAEVLREPAFDAREFELLKTENVAGLEQQLTDPQSLAISDAFRTLDPWPKGHPYEVLSIQGSIDATRAVTLADVRTLYGQVGASFGDVTLIGDLPADSVRGVLGELFGTWRSPVPYARIGRPHRDIAGANRSIETPDKANAFFIAGLNFPMRDDNAEYAAIALGNYILGGGFLNSRLATRIRQKDGLSYGVGSQVDVAPIDVRGRFLTFAIYAPENVIKLEAAFKEELARFIKDGPTQQELEEARTGYLQQRMQSRANDNELVGLLAGRLFQNRTMAFDVQLEQRLRTVTPDQVRAALAKYIDPAKLVTIKAGDFKKVIQQ